MYVAPPRGAPGYAEPPLPASGAPVVDLVDEGYDEYGAGAGRDYGADAQWASSATAVDDYEVGGALHIPGLAAATAGVHTWEQQEAAPSYEAWEYNPDQEGYNYGYGAEGARDLVDL